MIHRLECCIDSIDKEKIDSVLKNVLAKNCEKGFTNQGCWYVDIGDTLERFVLSYTIFKGKEHEFTYVYIVANTKEFFDNFRADFITADFKHIVTPVVKYKD